MAAFHHRLLLNFSHTSPTSLPVSLGHCWRSLADRARSQRPQLWCSPLPDLCGHRHSALLSPKSLPTLRNEGGMRCCTARCAIASRRYRCSWQKVNTATRLAHVRPLRTDHCCVRRRQKQLPTDALPEERGFLVLLAAARAEGPNPRGARGLSGRAATGAVRPGRARFPRAARAPRSPGSGPRPARPLPSGPPSACRRRSGNSRRP